MIRKLVQIAIFLLVANAVYRVAPVTVHYLQFKDAVQELALFATPKTTDAELVDRVMTLADEHSVTLERDAVQVQRQNGQLTIVASYVEAMKLVPGYDYVHQFDVHAKAFNPAALR